MFSREILRDSCRPHCLYHGDETFSITDYYIDLHSGDGYEQLHPYVYYVGVVDEETAEKSLHMARHIGVKYVVRSTTATGGAYNYASSLGIPSILIERADTVTGPGRKWNRTKETSVILCFIFREEMSRTETLPSDASGKCGI